MDDTATSPSDFTVVAKPTTVSFPPGDTHESVTVLANGDTLPEADESFVLLSNPVNATLTQTRATATIVDDDTSP